MSAILSADDLNDFISPGVACIKPVETLPVSKSDEGNPYEVTTEDANSADKPPPAQISLTDCLACSGCVTSAEAVLISLQSHAEVLNALDSSPALDVARLSIPPIQNGVGTATGKIFVASVCPQVRASFAATCNVSEREAGWMIEQLLGGRQGLRSGGKYGNGFTWVVDTNAMREVSLVLGADEVQESLLSATSPELDQSEASADTPSRKPILSSACPGWICYAEKTHPHVLPHLSRLKSPQALTGTMLKSVLHARLGVSPDQIWHVAIMPCFDKKLEASRPEFTDITWRSLSSPAPPVRDVDCVITARELLMLADTRGISPPALPRLPLSDSSAVPFPDTFLSSFLFDQGPHRSRPRAKPLSAAGTSGGYLHHILATQQARCPGSTLTTTRGRNADVIEYAITRAGESSPVFRGARYYGFRNIQNLVRKLNPVRTSRLPASAGGRRQAGVRSGASNAGSSLAYAYVEVMACPGGCTNGGGQIKGDDGAVEKALAAKEWIQKVDEAYFSMEEGEKRADEEMDLGDEQHDHSLDYNTKSNPNTWNCSPHHNKNTQEQKTNTKNQPEILINGINPSRIHAVLTHWAGLTDVPIDRLVRTGYRGVESDVGKDRAGGGGGVGGGTGDRGGDSGKGKMGGREGGGGKKANNLAGVVDVGRMVELAGRW